MVILSITSAVQSISTLVCSCEAYLVIIRFKRFCRLFVASSPIFVTLLLRLSSLVGRLFRLRMPASSAISRAGSQAILFVDSSTPQADRDAGAVTIVQYMQLFVDHGWDVYLLPFDQIERPAAASKLMQAGIHLIFPARHGLLDWLERNVANFQIILLSRPTMAAALLPIIKSQHVMIGYYGHDLHYQRFCLEASHSGHAELNWVARRFLSLERSISRQVDVSYYPSAAEASQLKTLEPEAKIKELPAYYYDFDQLSRPNLVAGRRFLFVGNFRHQPNIDALRWLLEDIWPCIRHQLAGVEISIVGSNPPSDLVHSTRLARDIHWQGWVSDEELSHLYNLSRIVIVPLRYGAGVKHKVVAAVVQGSAVVTTAIGLQGLPELDGFVSLAETPPAFAKASSELIVDDDLWLDRVNAARKALSGRFSTQSIWLSFNDLHQSR